MKWSEMKGGGLSLALFLLSLCQICPLGDYSFSTGIWLESLSHILFFLNILNLRFSLSLCPHTSVSAYCYRRLFLSAFISLSLFLQLSISLLCSIILSGFQCLSVFPIPFISCYLPWLFYLSLTALISGALAFFLSLSNNLRPLPRCLMLKRSELFCTFCCTCYIYLKAKRQLVNQYDSYRLASDGRALHFN